MDEKIPDAEYLSAWLECLRRDEAAAERDMLLKRRPEGKLGRAGSARLLGAMREIDRIDNFLTPPNRRTSFRWQRIAIQVLKTIPIPSRKNRKWLGNIGEALEAKGYRVSEQSIIQFLKKWGSVVPYGIKHRPRITEQHWPRGDPKEQRRREGFELLGHGESQAKVARRMGVSRKTVSTWAAKHKIWGGWRNRQRGRPGKLH
jgi:hypothetical protein